MVGAVLFGVGIGFVMAVPISTKVLPAVRFVTLGGLAPALRGAIFMLIGFTLVGIAAHRMYQWIVIGTSQRRGNMDILTAININQLKERGPRIVTIGGGTGVSTLLRGLKRITSNLTAIVTIADDGGSSGRLRAELGMPSPGDARNCLIALSESGLLMEEIFDYRFSAGSGLYGHSLGNLLLAALYDGKGGMQQGLEAAAQLLAVTGRVIPVSNDKNLVLMGETKSGLILKGESEVGHAPDPLQRVWIEPQGSRALEGALQAIQEADMIVIGPGSLYTSVIPNFLLEGMRHAMAESKAAKVFVCNVATQRYETDGLGVAEHFGIFQVHADVPISHVIVNDRILDFPQEWGQLAVPPVSRIDGFEGIVVRADVVDEDFPTRHDPTKLAGVLLSIGPSSRNSVEVSD